MNIVRRFAVFVHGGALEVLLVLAVLLLIGQLGWPAVVRWWHLPSPGNVGLDRFDAETFAEDFVIYLPPSYHNRQSWPLVVFLHGSGQRGSDPKMLRNCGPLRVKLPAIVAAPQCVPSQSWQPAAVAELVGYLTSEYSVDRKRVYLVGYSMGGYGAWQTAAANPDMFAAIVPICGGGDIDNARVLSKVPVWAFHGAGDKVIPAAETERMVEAIREEGGHARLTIIQDAGHGICNEVCGRADLWEWLFKQRRSR